MSALPKPIIDVVEAARRVIAARKALHEAKKSGELSEKGLAKLSKQLKAEIRGLEHAVIRLEALLAQNATRRRGGTPIPWASIFGAVNSFVGLAAKIQAGDRTAVGDAARFVGEYGPGGRQTGHRRTDGTHTKEPDVIDGEWEDVT